MIFSSNMKDEDIIMYGTLQTQLMSEKKNRRGFILIFQSLAG
jgi:hypothetical protein